MQYRLSLSCHTAEDTKPCCAGDTSGDNFDTSTSPCDVSETEDTEPCSSSTPKSFVKTTPDYTRSEADHQVESISEHSVDASSENGSFVVIPHPFVDFDPSSSNMATKTSLQDYSMVNAEDTGGDAIVSRTNKTTGGATVPSHDTTTDDDIGGQPRDSADTVDALPSNPEMAGKKHAHLG